MPPYLISRFILTYSSRCESVKRLRKIPRRYNTEKARPIDVILSGSEESRLGCRVRSRDPSAEFILSNVEGPQDDTAGRALKQKVQSNNDYMKLLKNL
jgi:hypothetical protein